jgi:hypothetical protein
VEQQEITVAGRNYTFFPLQAFKTVHHLTKLKGIATQGLTGALTDVTKILDGIDENTLDNVIFPILKDCAVVCTTDAKKLATAADMNELYTHENLDEFFVVVAMILRFNFEPLLKKTLARFGIDLEKISAAAKEKARARLEKEQNGNDQQAQ